MEKKPEGKLEENRVVGHYMHYIQQKLENIWKKKWKVHLAAVSINTLLLEIYK